MGMFSEFASMTGLDSGYINEADIAEEMERLEEMPAAEMRSDDVFDMYVEAAIANEKNYNTIMMSIANEEFQYFMENGTELVYEGARLDAFFDKVKSLLDKAWQKIKSIFEKALNTVKAWTASDEAFVRKYGDKIKDATGEICKISDSYEVNMTEVKKDPYSEITASVRSAVNMMGKGAKAMASQGPNKSFLTDKNLDEKKYGSHGSREEVLNDFKKKIGMGGKKVVTISGPEVVSELREGKTARNNIKIHYNDAKKCIAGIKKSVEDAKREASKTTTVDDTTGSYSKLLSLCNKATSLMSGIQSLQLQAVKTYHSNCRTIARRVVSGKTYKETNESGMYSNFADLLE